MAKGAGFEPITGISPVRGTASLLSVARPLPSGLRWTSGVTWRPLLTCGDGSAGPGFRRAFCAADNREDATNESAPVEFYPYDLHLPVECDWVLPRQVDSPDGEAQFETAALAAIDALTAWHLSRELMLGDTESENPSLVSAATDVSAAAPVHPVTALGLLLDAWSACTQQSGDGRTGPIIHAPLNVIPALLAAGVIAQIGDVYHGPAGSLVSPGPGYPSGTAAAPTDGTAGTEDAWIYISGPVEYAVGAPYMSTGDVLVEPRLNMQRDWANRQAIHRFDPCCVFAVAAVNPTYPNELPSP